LGAETLEVGRVVRPHGLKGQVVVELWTNRAERMRPGTRLSAPSGPLEIVSASPLHESGGTARWLVDFAGVSSRAEAESLRDAVLRADPIEVDGALWVHEMVGEQVFSAGGELLGTVEAVQANPASDLLVLDDGHLVPLTFVVSHSEGRLTVEAPPGLFDL
jgi:16S rRNA processing protein RimM